MEIIYYPENGTPQRIGMPGDLQGLNSGHLALIGEPTAEQIGYWTVPIGLYVLRGGSIEWRRPR